MTNIKAGDTVRITERYENLGDPVSVGVKFVVTNLVYATPWTDSEGELFSVYALGDPMERGVWVNYLEVVEEAGLLRRSEVPEPSAARPGPPVYLAADLWDALGAPTADFDSYYARNGWADTWANLLGTVRDHFKPKCGHDTDGEPCVLTAGHLPPHYGASDVGRSEPVPEPSVEDQGPAASCHLCVGAGGYEDHDGVWVECSCQRAEPQGEPSDAQVEAAMREHDYSLDRETTRAVLRAAWSVR